MDSDARLGCVSGCVGMTWQTFGHRVLIILAVFGCLNVALLLYALFVRLNP